MKSNTDNKIGFYFALHCTSFCILAPKIDAAGFWCQNFEMDVLFGE